MASAVAAPTAADIAVDTATTTPAAPVLEGPESSTPAAVVQAAMMPEHRDTTGAAMPAAPAPVPVAPVTGFVHQVTSESNATSGADAVVLPVVVNNTTTAPAAAAVVPNVDDVQQVVQDAGGVGTTSASSHPNASSAAPAIPQHDQAAASGQPAGTTTATHSHHHHHSTAAAVEKTTTALGLEQTTNKLVESLQVYGVGPLCAVQKAIFGRIAHGNGTTASGVLGEQVAAMKVAKVVQDTGAHQPGGSTTKGGATGAAGAAHYAMQDMQPGVVGGAPSPPTTATTTVPTAISTPVSSQVTSGAASAATQTATSVIGNADATGSHAASTAKHHLQQIAINDAMVQLSHPSLTEVVHAAQVAGLHAAVYGGLFGGVTSVLVAVASEWRKNQVVVEEAGAVEEAADSAMQKAAPDVEKDRGTTKILSTSCEDEIKTEPTGALSASDSSVEEAKHETDPVELATARVVGMMNTEDTTSVMLKKDYKPDDLQAGEVSTPPEITSTSSMETTVGALEDHEPESGSFTVETPAKDGEFGEDGKEGAPTDLNDANLKPATVLQQKLLQEERRARALSNISATATGGQMNKREDSGTTPGTTGTTATALNKKPPLHQIALRGFVQGAFPAAVSAAATSATTDIVLLFKLHEALQHTLSSTYIYALQVASAVDHTTSYMFLLLPLPLPAVHLSPSFMFTNGNTSNLLAATTLSSLNGSIAAHHLTTAVTVAAASGALAGGLVMMGLDRYRGVPLKKSLTIFTAGLLGNILGVLTIGPVGGALTGVAFRLLAEEGIRIPLQECIRHLWTHQVPRAVGFVTEEMREFWEKVNEFLVTVQESDLVERGSRSCESGRLFISGRSCCLGPAEFLFAAKGRCGGGGKEKQFSNGRVEKENKQALKQSGGVTDEKSAQPESAAQNLAPGSHEEQVNDHEIETENLESAGTGGSENETSDKKQQLKPLVTSWFEYPDFSLLEQSGKAVAESYVWLEETYSSAKERIHRICATGAEKEKGEQQPGSSSSVADVHVDAEGKKASAVDDVVEGNLDLDGEKTSRGGLHVPQEEIETANAEADGAHCGGSNAAGAGLAEQKSQASTETEVPDEAQQEKEAEEDGPKVLGDENNETATHPAESVGSDE
ncbi:unnamed protein product [Amoebophrya sp. A120]|nr:unnamed protein product [Amoebophrya sp. A120]|eukprot:GSA120T00017237001.1